MCHTLLKIGANREELQRIGPQLSLKGYIHTAIDRRYKIVAGNAEGLDTKGNTAVIVIDSDMRFPRVDSTCFGSTQSQRSVM